MDRLGAGVSLFCVAHCLALPMLTALTPGLLRHLPGDDLTHRLLLLPIILFGALAFRRGLKLHGHRWVPGLFLLGAILVAAAALCGEGLLTGAGEAVITSCGSLLIISSHLLNHLFCSRCECCR